MVRPAKGAILGYKPEPPPASLPPEAQRYLDQELHRIAGVLQGLMALLSVIKSTKVLALEPMSAPPASPLMPDIVFADGVGWDPGSGAGYYYYNGTVWTPIG